MQASHPPTHSPSRPPTHPLTRPLTLLTVQLSSFTAPLCAHRQVVPTIVRWAKPPYFSNADEQSLMNDVLISSMTNSSCYIFSTALFEARFGGQRCPLKCRHRTLHPSPFTLHLHPSPFTLHPSPFTLQPSPFTLHPSPFTLHPSPSSVTSCSIKNSSLPVRLHHKCQVGRRDRCLWDHRIVRLVELRATPTPNAQPNKALKARCDFDEEAVRRLEDCAIISRFSAPRPALCVNTARDITPPGASGTADPCPVTPSPLIN